MTNKEWALILLGLAAIAVVGLVASGRLTLQPTRGFVPLKNEEIWEWVDYKNQKRRLVVHRSIEQS